MLSPVRVFRCSNVRSGLPPFLGDFIGIVNPEVGRAADGSRIVVSLRAADYKGPEVFAFYDRDGRTAFT